MNFLRAVDNGIQASEILDARELNGLFALFQAKRKIGKLTTGQVLRIDGTDPHFGKDFNKWCDRSGNEYLGEKDMHKYISFFIKKG